MNLSKFAVSVVACVASALMVGCGGGEVQVQANAPVPAGGAVMVQGGAPQAQVVEAEGPQAPVTVNVAPPAEQVEVVPVAPRGDFMWIKGHWRWNGVNWIWIRGHYVARRVGWRWVPPHYEARAGVWLFIRGHWER